MPEITKVMLSGEFSEEVQRLQVATSKHMVEYPEFREVILIPDLMASNSNGWARVKKLSLVARENIRGVAFYVAPESSKRAEPNPYGSTSQVLARDMRDSLPYLESFYIIKDTGRCISSVPPSQRAWKTLVAGFPVSFEERQAWVNGAGSDCAVNLLMWLVCLISKRERHERCLRMARGWASSTDEDTGVGSRSKMELKVVEWASQN